MHCWARNIGAHFATLMSTSQVLASSSPYLSFMSGFVGIFTVHLCVEIKTCEATYVSFFVFVQRSYALEGEAESDQLCVIDRNMFCIRTPRVSLSDGRVCVCVCSSMFCCLSGMLSKQLPQARSRGIVHAGALAEGITDLWSDDSFISCLRMILRLRETFGPSFMDCRHRCRGRCPRRKHSAGSLRFGDLHENGSEFRTESFGRTTDLTWVTCESPESSATKPCSQLLQFLKSLRWQEFLQIRSLRLKLLWRWGSYLLTNQKLRTNHTAWKSGYELIWKWKCETRSLDWS